MIKDNETKYFSDYQPRCLPDNKHFKSYIVDSENRQDDDFMRQVKNKKHNKIGLRIIN